MLEKIDVLLQEKNIPYNLISIKNDRFFIVCDGSLTSMRIKSVISFNFKDYIVSINNYYDSISDSFIKDKFEIIGTRKKV